MSRDHEMSLQPEERGIEREAHHYCRECERPMGYLELEFCDGCEDDARDEDYDDYSPDDVIDYDDDDAW